MRFRGWFRCMNHQNKARAYIDALYRNGYRLTEWDDRALFMLSDLDVLGRAQVAEKYHEAGKPFLLYPHAARPPIWWDGMYESSPFTTAIFTTGRAGIDVPRAYGLVDKPIHAVGWTFCPIIRFRPTGSIRNVLFAPIHVNANGWLSEEDKEINARTYRILLDLVKLGKINLSVRYVRSLLGCGLWVDERAKIIRGRPNQDFTDIDRTDVVVSHQTFAYIAVARGKPTIMMAEGVPPRSGNSEEKYLHVQNWDTYKHMIMYPLDILECENPEALLRRAVQTDEDIADWRRRVIGQPFNGDKFVQLVERYL